MDSFGDWAIIIFMVVIGLGSGGQALAVLDNGNAVTAAMYGLVGLVTLGLAGSMAAERLSGRRSTATGDARRPCPHCAEAILPNAKVCRFCGRDVEPMSEDGVAS